MNKTIYILWTEANDLTPRRKNNLQIMKDYCGVELKFLDHITIQDYELPEHKFHEAYQYLSATHKSDYLRSYLMHFYGGGYCDIKKAEWDWNKYFNELDIDYLAQRTKEGQEVNDMTKDKIMFLTKNNLENF